MWWKHVHAGNAGRLKGHRTPWTTINKTRNFVIFIPQMLSNLWGVPRKVWKQTSCHEWKNSWGLVCVCGWILWMDDKHFRGSRTRGCGTTTKMFTHIHSLILQSYRWYRRHTCLVRWNGWWYLLRGNDIGIMLDIKAPMNNGRGSLHFGWISRMGFFYK